MFYEKSDEDEEMENFIDDEEETRYSNVNLTILISNLKGNDEISEHLSETLITCPDINPTDFAKSSSYFTKSH